MPSPFPGMNPYLEREEVWQDFHQTFIPTVRTFLVPRLGEDYVVKLEEFVFIHELPAEDRAPLGRPDLLIARPGTNAAQASAAPSIAAPAYAWINPAVDVERHAYLEIRDREGMGLVTVIELLSPSNKREGSDREQYLSKRRAIFSSNVHLVELDLLRGGPRLPLTDLPDCSYYALVSRAEDRPRVAIWPLSLRDRLPVVPIPLRAPDRAVELDLQEVLHNVYDAAGYARRIYRGNPRPPLNPHDAQWAEQFSHNTNRPILSRPQGRARQLLRYP